MLIAFSGGCFAQEKHYRVEILVLSHLRHESEPLKVDQPRDYSNALDFLIVPDPDELAQVDQDGSELPVEPASGEESLMLGADTLLPPEEEIDPWAGVMPVETRSDVMQEAWRRLRLSAPFRPQQYLSWVQSADEPFPVLRIHNQEIVLVDDPYAEQRAELALAEEEDSAMVFSDQGQSLPDDPAAESNAEPELPDPTLYYELDGTVQLTRSRFLHLQVDLELREPLFEAMTMGEPSLAPPVPSGGDAITPPRPTSFEVHKLQQKRQIKTDRMEYFDGPVIGILAYVTPFDMETQADRQDVAEE
jgi:hypothetical protein